MEETIIYLIFGLTAFVALFIVIAVIIVRRKISRKIDQIFFREQWQKILSQFTNNPQHAILNADKLIDKALTLKGYKGTLGEKLRTSGKLFSDLNGLWRAHKLRNSIAHEIDHKISHDQARDALNSFQKALRELGIQI